MENNTCLHRFKCLLCSDTAVFCDCTENSHSEHPRQPLVSDDVLMSKFGIEEDDPEYVEINIFSCPYCDRQHLSISTLYDHLTLEHLDVPFSVRCPVCVCFFKKPSKIEGIHLSEHLAKEHSATWEQYHEHILVYETYGDDEREVLKFIASTLPPTYHAGTSSSSSSTPTSTSVGLARSAPALSAVGSARSTPNNETKTLGRKCSICFDLVFESSCRELSCHHKFHSECINLWMSHSRTCPLCRKVVSR